MKKLLFTLTTLLSLHPLTMEAQQNAFFFHENKNLNQSMRWQEYKLGPESNSSLQKYQIQKPQLNAIEKELTQYLKASNDLLALYKNAEERLARFAQQTPLSQLRQRSFYQLAEYYFKANRYSEAVVYYENAGEEYLAASELKQRNHNLAIAYASIQNKEKYNELKESIKLSPTDKYLNAVLDYLLGDTEMAMNTMNEKDLANKHKDEVRYYNLEANYFNGNKNQLEKQIPTLLKQKDNFKYRSLLHQLQAQLDIEKENYKQAETHLREYYKSNTPRDIDLYRKAFVAYQRGEISSCLNTLNRMPKSKDKLSQQAYYLSAMCYIMQDSMQAAYNALLDCVGTNQENKLNELAELNLAKLSYKLDNRVWCIKQLEYFLRSYPQSPLRSEAAALLVHQLIRNEQVESALSWFKQEENALTKNALREAFTQKAWQELKDAKYNKAIESAIQVSKQDIDMDETLSFIQAEALYKSGKYRDALGKSNEIASKNPTNKNLLRDNLILRCFLYKELNEPANLYQAYKELNPNSKLNPTLALGVRKPDLTFRPDISSSWDPEFISLDYDEKLLATSYTPYPLLQSVTEQLGNANSSFLRAGIGNLSSREIALGLDVSQTANMPLYFNYNTRGIKGKISGQQVGESHAGLYSELKRNGYSVKASAEWEQNKFHYFGFDRSKYSFTNSEILQRFNSIGLNLEMNETPNNELGIQYRPSLQFRTYSDASTAKENNLRLNLPFEKSFLQNQLLASVALDVESNRLNVDSLSQIQNSNRISIQPSISYKLDKAIFKIGVYPTFAKQNHLLPDVSVAYKITSLRSMVSLNYNSLLRMNTFRELSSTNPFIKNDYLLLQGRENNINLQLNGNMGDYTMYALRLGKKRVENMPFYLRDTLGDRKQFAVLYSPRVDMVDAEFAIDYHAHSNLYIGGKITIQPIINIESLREAWQYVPASIELYQKFKLTRKLSIRAESFVLFGYSYLDRSEVVNKLFKNTSKLGLDMNLLADLKLGKATSAYLNIYNLLGTKYQRWDGYTNFQRNFTIGLQYRFKTF